MLKTVRGGSTVHSTFFHRRLVGFLLAFLRRGYDRRRQLTRVASQDKLCSFKYRDPRDLCVVLSEHTRAEVVQTASKACVASSMMTTSNVRSYSCRPPAPWHVASTTYI